jgi:hypothetical protein
LPNSEDTQAILQHVVSFAKAAEVPTGTDRIIAISMGALLDNLVEEGIVHLLKNKDSDTMAELFSDHGPLGTFSSKIQLAYALGTIDDTTKDDLNCIRRIRNVCAHARISVTMDTPLVAKECKKLNFSRHLGGDIDQIALQATVKEMNPRQRFIAGATFLAWVIQLKKLDRLKSLSPNPKFGETIKKLQDLASPTTQLKRILAAKAHAKSTGSS